jgi:hypothetical protein
MLKSNLNNIEKMTERMNDNVEEKMDNIEGLIDGINNINLNIDYDELHDIGILGYKITKDGRVWSDKSSMFLKTRVCNGYNTIILNKIHYTIHRLIAKNFIPNPENKPYVNHIDCNKLNNRIENLEWVTQEENCAAHNQPISHPKRVLQINSEGNVINSYNSIKEASEAIGLTPSSITKVVTGKNQTAGGYKWKYENEDDDNVNNEDIDLTNCKNVQGHKKYIIFPDGKVYNLVRKTFLKPIKNKNGHTYITISSNNTKKNHYIHTLVAEHFLENPENKKTIHHINGIRDDNRLENLKWV